LQVTDIIILWRRPEGVAIGPDKDLCRYGDIAVCGQFVGICADEHNAGITGVMLTARWSRGYRGVRIVPEPLAAALWTG